MIKQCQFKVYKHLVSGKSITALQANTPHFDHCSRLAPIIKRLRKAFGEKSIITTMLPSETGGAPYARYTYKPR